MKAPNAAGGPDLRSARSSGGSTPAVNKEHEEILYNAFSKFVFEKLLFRL